jgi:hypothetical protein
LKEKGLYKDLLILENVPDRQINNAIRKTIGRNGHLVYDVIEVSRR